MACRRGTSHGAPDSSVRAIGHQPSNACGVRLVAHSSRLASGRDLQRARVRRHGWTPRSGSHREGRHRTGRRHRRPAGVHVSGQRRAGDAQPGRLHDAGPVRVRARADAADAGSRSASATRSSRDIRSSTCIASTCRWNGGNREERWRRRSRSAARWCTCSRRISACASANGGFRCGRSSNTSIRSATRCSSCSVTSTTGYRGDRSCTCSIAASDSHRVRRRFPRTGRSWRWIGSGFTRHTRCDASSPTRRRPRDVASDHLPVVADIAAT